jgi:hypothetical protein
VVLRGMRSAFIRRLRSAFIRSLRTAIVCRRGHGLLGAEEPLDKVSHVIGMPQWIAGEDGVRLRPAGLGDQLQGSARLANAACPDGGCC